ncbi:uncharacterized protein LOC119725347 [Patiria miniata]|uniref:arylamine N-acetyltransferase n=1 Tax=Patiria miniata TaxID=46514 RepID=A0A913ZLJ7_PATMI|nr:uncharacterized protein LOC119725347 [Patiria miniata]XP_038052673.1 uncharacterized protein LOC119725347 [Patiria miniata]XP_038052674.1 uncharacterized protein LOC119725347 [Patiria miniata]
MSSSTDSLSLGEAKEFLENTLQLQSPMSWLNEDRGGFLLDVIASCYRRIPFQSMTAIATPKPERRRLTFPEIKVNMMTRQGGICCEMNRFIKLVLETLGFEIYHISCTGFGKPNNHMSNVVKNLNRPGDLHLVDIGTGFPLSKPIPLNFDKESPMYKEGSLFYKFVKDVDGSFRLVNRICQNYNECPPESVVDDWYTFLEFNLKCREFQFFADSMENVHTVEDGPKALAPFLISLRAVDFRNGRLFAIKDTTILEEDASGKVNKKRISSPQELLEAYKVHFPQFPVETVQQAIQTVQLKF